MRPPVVMQSMLEVFDRLFEFGEGLAHFVHHAEQPIVHGLKLGLEGFSGRANLLHVAVGQSLDGLFELDPTIGMHFLDMSEEDQGHCEAHNDAAATLSDLFENFEFHER